MYNSVSFSSHYMSNCRIATVESESCRDTHAVMYDNYYVDANNLVIHFTSVSRSILRSLAVIVIVCHIFEPYFKVVAWLL